MAGKGNAFVAKLGPYRADSDPRSADRLLVSLLVERGMDGPGRCVVELAGPLHDPVARGEAVTVELDAGAGSLTVFTGTCEATTAFATGQRIHAVDALARLASLRIEASFADAATDFIAKDVIGKAGATAGTIAPGPTLATCVLRHEVRALRHLADLASLAGADLWTDGTGKVQMAAPSSGAADHQLRLGETILALDLRGPCQADAAIRVVGEGAAAAKGSDAAHVLTTDLAGVLGKASLDANGKVQPGKAPEDAPRRGVAALRTGEAAGKAAEAWAKSVAARRIRGRIELTGAPEIEPGDQVSLDGLPADHAVAKLLDGGQTLRVRSVRHVLDRARGLRTTLEV